jgi:hypothetical protein
VDSDGVLMPQPYPSVLECFYEGEPAEDGKARLYFWPRGGIPPTVSVRTKWGGAVPHALSDKGLGGEKLAYDFRKDGQYLGLDSVDRCPADLEKAIRLRQRLLSEVMPPWMHN